MLRAAVLHNGKLVSYDVLYLKEKGHSPADIRQKDWRCPHCDHSVDSKLGLVRAWHFAHVKQQKADCPTERELEPESVQHIEMKKALAQKLVTLYGEGKVQFEAALASPMCC